jgi:hypothetical protein
MESLFWFHTSIRTVIPIASIHTFKVSLIKRLIALLQFRPNVYSLDSIIVGFGAREWHNMPEEHETPWAQRGATVLFLFDRIHFKNDWAKLFLSGFSRCNLNNFQISSLLWFAFKLVWNSAARILGCPKPLAILHTAIMARIFKFSDLLQDQTFAKFLVWFDDLSACRFGVLDCLLAEKTWLIDAHTNRLKVSQRRSGWRLITHVLV